MACCGKKSSAIYTLKTEGLVTAASGKTLLVYRYKSHQAAGERVPFRVEYVIDKSLACQRLLGHPYIARSMRRLLGGNILRVWDSMVFKQKGRGARVSWHRDQRRGSIGEEGPLAINVDFYLDPVDSSNCLRGVPGSQTWSDEAAQHFIDGLGQGEFSNKNAVPLIMEPRDALLHDVFVLHGSPESMSDLRRILYFEFRNAEGEATYGPHTTAYVARERAMLAYCTALRPTGSGDGSSCQLRVPHDQYWQVDSVFVAGQLTD